MRRALACGALPQGRKRLRAIASMNTARSLFDYPELYDHLRTPETRVFDQVYSLMEKLLGRPPKSVMDPACGPATWLAYFAKRNIPVAGNDISAAMVESARRKCGVWAHEFIEGDMCALEFKKGPYEVTLELSGTCGLLASEQSFHRFLSTVKTHTMPGGLIMLTIFFLEPVVQFPHHVETWEVPLWQGGRARISYEVVQTDSSRRVDLVRRTVHTHGPEECPRSLVDHYEMFSWTEEHFREVMAKCPDLRFEQAFAVKNDTVVPVTPGQLEGEVSVVFRRL